MDGGRKDVEEAFLLRWENVEGNGVDGELTLIGGEPELGPRGLAHGEGLIEAGGKGLEVGLVGSGGGGRVGEENGDSSFVIDLSGEGQGKGAVGLAEKRGSNVGERSRDDVSLGVGDGGRPRGPKSPAPRVPLYRGSSLNPNPA